MIALYYNNKTYAQVSEIKMAQTELLDLVDRVNSYWPRFFYWIEFNKENSLIINNLRPNYGSFKWAVVNNQQLPGLSDDKPRKLGGKALNEEELENLRLKLTSSAKSVRPAKPKATPGK